MAMWLYDYMVLLLEYWGIGIMENWNGGVLFLPIFQHSNIPFFYQEPFCDPAGIRTQDPILKRDVLYLLSY